jgi:hypothetical protein
MTSAQKKTAAAGVVACALAAAVAALNRGEKISCTEPAKAERLQRFEARLVECDRANDAACAAQLESDFQRTVEACK